MMQNNNEHDRVITEPVNLQSRHEEADTLVAFHAKQAPEGNILIRSTDTDVLVILLGLAGRSRESYIILDNGSGNHRRYIVVSKIAAILNELDIRLYHVRHKRSKLQGLHTHERW